MACIFGYFPPKLDVPVDILVEFLNLDAVHTLEDSQILALILGIVPPYTRPSPDIALKLLPFIRISLQYEAYLDISVLYRCLDCSNKLQIINDLQRQNIRHSHLVWYLNNDEIELLLKRNKNLSDEVLKQCLDKVGNNIDPYDCLLNPIGRPNHRLVSKIISRYVDAPKSQPTTYLEKPTLVRRCKYMFVRGKNKGNTCSQPAIHGDIYCKCCCRKKSLPIPSFRLY